uniref:Kinesin motor domain-containing protein n=1 Tax=Noctiluca scintillans TaxID=2966 RepID=A0A7S1F2Y7_NOCSC|mmetsp:Transcript_30153/g.80453  ORF Transcript_30153/g.80453 Transcript_30153/m.80453 type:complete len:1127 (+) Transcript_30153:1-3381(+)
MHCGLEEMPQRGALDRFSFDAQSVGSPTATDEGRSGARSPGCSDEGRDTIKVCVRIRPANSFESRDAPSVRCIAKDALILNSGSCRDGSDKMMEAKFDWVLSGDATQANVYDVLGRRIVEGCVDGFHGCAFAYGQTGSGKSHTIFGGPLDARGLLPRIAEGLFAELDNGGSEYLVKVSYLEIYNEKVRDLLNPSTTSGVAGGQHSLEVRRHPQVGVFVEGLTHNVAETAEDVMRLVDYGHKMRVVGTTNLNAVSSRSHAVVTLNVERTFGEEVKGVRKVRRAQLHAVDLSGSERMETSGPEIRQKESKEINKSLLALSLTISRLAQQEKHSADPLHIPYRNSKLTYMLSNALMGNCKTVLLACVSPSVEFLHMTESTLRFALSAKKIQTQPVKNEEVHGNLMASLRAEIEMLRQQLSDIGAEQKGDVIERMATAQLLHSQFSSTKEELQAQAAASADQRQQVLLNLGLNSSRLTTAVALGETVSVRGDADPYLVNICDDPLLSGCLVYTIPRGKVIRMGSSPSCAIFIDGLGIQPETCSLVCNDGLIVEITVAEQDNKCTEASSFIGYDRLSGERRRSSASLTKCGARQGRRGSLFKNGVAQVFVENELVVGTRKARNKDKMRIGRAHVFQLFVPQDRQEPQDARITKLVDDLVMDSNGGHMLAKEYAAHLKERIGSERAFSVFSALQEIQPLVDEANDITDELRGGEEHEFVFKAHVLTDVTSVGRDPEIMVALHTTERPDEIDNHGIFVYRSGTSNGACSLTAVWSKSLFLSRLDAMREVYHDVCHREDPWGQTGDLDPWCKFGSGIPYIGGGEGHRPIACTGEDGVEPETEPTDGDSQNEFNISEQLSALEAEQQRMHSELVGQLIALGSELEETRAELLERIPALDLRSRTRMSSTEPSLSLDGFSSWNSGSWSRPLRGLQAPAHMGSSGSSCSARRSESLGWPTKGNWWEWVPSATSSPRGRSPVTSPMSSPMSSPVQESKDLLRGTPSARDSPRWQLRQRSPFDRSNVSPWKTRPRSSNRHITSRCIGQAVFGSSASTTPGHSTMIGTSMSSSAGPPSAAAEELVQVTARAFVRPVVLCAGPGDRTRISRGQQSPVRTVMRLSSEPPKPLPKCIRIESPL